MQVVFTIYDPVSFNESVEEIGKWNSLLTNTILSLPGQKKGFGEVATDLFPNLDKDVLNKISYCETIADFLEILYNVVNNPLYEFEDWCKQLEIQVLEIN